MQFRPRSLPSVLRGLGSRHTALFAGSFLVFLVLLSVTQVAFSPASESSFDSSSIDNREKRLPDALKKEIFPLGPEVSEGVSDPEAGKDSAPPEPLPSGQGFRHAGSAASPDASLSPVRKQPSSPRVTFAFRPDAVKVDDKLVELLRANLRARAFKEKVTPIAVTVDSVRVEPRGQLSGREVIVSSAMPTDSEKLQVFVHELGHVVDIHYLKAGMFGSDPSEEFYSASWDTYKVKKKGAKLSNFVSGYALSNKYEDFAESFSFFVFHNAEFKRRARTDATLARKYAFFADRVFEKDEFAGTDFGSEKVKAYFWDSTKLAINPKKYLFYIR